MRYCTFCRNVCEDDAVSCSICGNILVPKDSPDVASDPAIASSTDSSSGANSSSANSSGANSSGANSSGANSSGANSSGANSSGLEPTQPIWVTQKTDLPLDSLLKEDELWDDSSLDNNDLLQDGNSHSYGKAPEKDTFDEIAESASLLFSNMSPKLRKFLLITLITTLLSVILYVYTSCTNQSNSTDGLSQIISTVIQNSSGAAVP